MLLVLLPVLGLRNAYYLEVATQIGIYVALALGLNIVVGFAGLLDLGYVAFYAVGAYVWAIFGSSHANEFATPGSLVVAAIGCAGAGSAAAPWRIAGVQRIARRENALPRPWGSAAPIGPPRSSSASSSIAWSGCSLGRGWAASAGSRCRPAGSSPSC